ncbi:isochorismatase family protein [Denitromonas sp.]|uniref:isochorismatase family protein n=1 Tax=Denitromonas sp. TaxID=2734609 RepID=UPI003A8B56BF
MKIERDNAALLVVDMQDRVLNLVPGHETTLNQCRWLTELARDMNVPVLASEHYARGLGPVTDSLLALIGETNVVSKAHFSCVEDGCMAERPELKRQQWILCGIEAHACVMLTALDLRAAGKDVFVVTDAIASRGAEDKQRAIERMASVGIVPVTREMVLFEFLRKAGTPEFKEMSKKFLQ